MIWCSRHVTPFGHTRPTSISGAGVATPSTTTIPLRNLGTTTPLPASPGSPDVEGGTWAKVGVASTSAAMTRNKMGEHFIIKPLATFLTFCFPLRAAGGSGEIWVPGRVRFSGRAQGLDVGPYVELPHLLEQRRPRHTKQLRGLFDAAARAGQHSADVVPFGPTADLREGSKQAPGSDRLRRLQRKERFYADPRRMRERHRPLNTVAELAHIASPGMLQQGLLGGR